MRAVISTLEPTTTDSEGTLPRIEREALYREVAESTDRAPGGIRIHDSTVVAPGGAWDPKGVTFDRVRFEDGEGRGSEPMSTRESSAPAGMVDATLPAERGSSGGRIRIKDSIITNHGTPGTVEDRPNITVRDSTIIERGQGRRVGAPATSALPEGRCSLSEQVEALLKRREPRTGVPLADEELERLTQYERDGILSHRAAQTLRSKATSRITDYKDPNCWISGREIDWVGTIAKERRDSGERDYLISMERSLMQGGVAGVVKHHATEDSAIFSTVRGRT